MGSISKNFGSNDAYTITVAWEEVSQSISNNQTKLKFTCTLTSNRSSATYTGQSGTDTLKVGGVSYSVKHSSYTLPGSGSITFWEKTITVTHDDGGSYSKAISAAIKINNTFTTSGYIGTITASGTLTCTTIARASALTFGTITLGSATSLDIGRKSSSFTHTITYTFGSTSGTIATKTTKTTISWTPPLSLASEIPNSKTGTGTLKITTYYGSTEIGSKSYSFTAKTTKASLAPTLSSGWVAASYYNTGTAAESIAAFVQGYSRAQITFYASKITTQYGATIKSYEISCNGKTVSSSPYRTQVLTDTSAEITCTVTDSRGYSRSSTLTVTLYAYSRPKLSAISIYRSDSSGNEDDAGTYLYAKAKRTYYSIGGLNTCTLKCYYKTKSGSYDSGTTLTSGTGKVIASSVRVNLSYVVKIVATDSLGNSATYSKTIPTASVALHLRPGGTGAAFGKYSEKNNALEISQDWDLYALGDASIGGDLILGGNVVADYVVENGYYSDDETEWRWRKWNGGTYDLYGTVSVTPTTSTATANGAAYYSEQVQVALPFNITSAVFTGSAYTGYAWITNCAIVSTDEKLIGFRILRFANVDSVEFKIRIVCHGRWK